MHTCVTTPMYIHGGLRKMSGILLTLHIIPLSLSLDKLDWHRASPSNPPVSIPHPYVHPHTHTQCWGYKHKCGHMFLLLFSWVPWLHTQALLLVQSHLPSSLTPLVDQIAFLHMPVICR